MVPIRQDKKDVVGRNHLSTQSLQLLDDLAAVVGRVIDQVLKNLGRTHLECLTAWRRQRQLLSQPVFIQLRHPAGKPLIDLTEKSQSLSRILAWKTVTPLVSQQAIQPDIESPEEVVRRSQEILERAAHFPGPVVLWNRFQHADEFRVGPMEITPEREKICSQHPAIIAQGFQASRLDASYLTPLLDMRPTLRNQLSASGERFARHLSADLYFVDWLESQGHSYDVITEHDLDREGTELLAPYRVVVTGSHPEYTSQQMLDGLESHE